MLDDVGYEIHFLFLSSGLLLLDHAVHGMRTPLVLIGAAVVLYVETSNRGRIVLAATLLLTSVDAIRASQLQRSNVGAAGAYLTTGLGWRPDPASAADPHGLPPCTATTVGRHRCTAIPMES